MQNAVQLFQFLCLLAILILPGCTQIRGAGDNAYEQYAGDYVLDENTTAIVRPNRGSLMAKISGQDYFEVFRREGDSFIYKVVDAQVMFRRDANGEVSGFSLRQDNKDYEFY